MTSRANWSFFSTVDGNAVNRLVPPVVSLLLVIAIGWQLARMIWMLIPGDATGMVVPMPTVAPRQDVVSATQTDVNTIAAAHIFGVADEEAVVSTPIVQADDDLVDTRLVNLTLNGTVASDIPKYSVAIISDSGNDQQVYTIGDSVATGATLHAVYADRVVLNENGVLTNLKLPREFKEVAASNTRSQLSSTRQSPDNSQTIQSVVTENLSRLTDVIRPTPYRVQGEQVGFRVYPGRDRRQFAALGLRPGDIIRDIDGQSLSDATQAMQIFQSLGTAEQVTVTLERNGQSETLTLKTSQLDITGEQTQ
jgi:general secretion pathway protein C